MVRERVAIGRYATLRSDPEGRNSLVPLISPRHARNCPVPRELAQHALTLLGSIFDVVVVSRLPMSATRRRDGDRGQFQSLEF
jgi:hypothetical protein